MSQITAVTTDSVGRIISFVEGEYSVTVRRDAAGRPLAVRAIGARPAMNAEFRYSASGALTGVIGNFKSALLSTLVGEASRGGAVAVGGNVDPVTGVISLLLESGAFAGPEVLAFPFTSDGITSAISRVVATGNPGVVRLAPVSYACTDSVTFVSGVSVLGTPPVLSISSNVPESSWQLSGGTVLEGPGGFPAFKYNNTPLANPITNFSSNMLSSVRVGGFGVDGFTRGIDVGATKSGGAIFSVFEDIQYINCSEWGVSFENSIYCQFKRISGRVTSNAVVGGQRYASTVSSAVLIPGNSIFEHLFSWGMYRLNRGIVFEQSAGSTFNELNVSRLQVNKVGESQASQSATFTNGSANIGVSDGSEFPVGIPANFTSSGNGFSTAVTYYVVSRVGNVIQLGLRPGATSIVSSGTTGLTIETGGFPNLEIIAAPGEYMNNSRFMGLDLESINGISLSACGLSNFDVDIQEVSPTAKQHVVIRAASDSVVQLVKSGAKTDFDNAAAGVRYMGGTSRTAIGQTGHGFWNNKYTSAGSPSAVAGAAAGTGPTITMGYATNDGGAITITTGTSPSTGVVAVVTATTQALYGVYCPVLQPTNAAANALSGAAKLRAQQTPRGTGFDIVADVALAPSTTYTFNFRM